MESLGFAALPAGSAKLDYGAFNAAPLRLEYPQRLTMYTQPPSMEISMEEFEAFALDRLQGMFALSLQ
jgi:hypothetical protein